MAIWPYFPLAPPSPSDRNTPELSKIIRGGEIGEIATNNFFLFFFLYVYSLNTPHSAKKNSKKGGKEERPEGEIGTYSDLSATNPLQTRYESATNTANRK